MSHGTSTRGLRRRVADDRASDGRGRPDQPLRAVRRGRPRRRAREVRRARAGRRRDWKTRQAEWFERFWTLLRRPATGTRWRETDCRGRLQRRSSPGGERRDPTRSRCRHREHAGHRRRRGQEHRRSTVIATRGERLALLVYAFRARPRPEAFGAELLDHRRESTPTTGSLAASRSTPTTSTPPSRNSTPGTSPAKRPPTRTRGRSSRGPMPQLNRHEVPESTPDWVNIDHRRAIAYRAR